MAYFQDAQTVFVSGILGIGIAVGLVSGTITSMHVIIFLGIGIVIGIIMDF